MKRQFAIALVLLALVSQTACSPDQIREARKAGHRIQVVLDGATDTLIVLNGKHIVSPEKSLEIAQALKKVNLSNEVLIRHAKAATTADVTTRQTLLNDLSGIVNAVTELKATGLLAIKSENGTLAFDAAISAINTAIEIMRGALQ